MTFTKPTPTTLQAGLNILPSRINGMGAVFIVYKFAALKETPGYRGVSHLAEHLLYKAIDDVSAEMDANGIDANAFTGDDVVVFMLSGLDDRVELFQKKFLSIIDFVPTEEMFDIEKDIVFQEYNMSASRQNFISNNVMRVYFDYYSAIGKKEDIEELTYANFIAFIERYRRPFAIVRYGALNGISEHARHVEYSHSPNIPELKRGFNPENAVSLASFPNSMITLAWRSFKTYEIDPRDLELIGMMWTNGLTSPLMNEIREKRGLSYGMAMYSNTFGSTVINGFWCLCNPDKGETVDKLFIKMTSNWRKWLTESRFNNTLDCMKCANRIAELTEFADIETYIDPWAINNSYLESVTWDRIVNVLTKIQDTEWTFCSSAETNIFEEPNV